MLIKGVITHHELASVRRSEPVSGALAQLLYALHPSNTRCQVRAEKAGIGCLMCQPPHSGKVLVDGVCRQRTRLQVYAVANQDDAIERQPRLGTIPGDELLDCVFIDPP